MNTTQNQIKVGNTVKASFEDPTSHHDAIESLGKVISVKKEKQHSSDITATIQWEDGSRLSINMFFFMNTMQIIDDEVLI